MSKQYVMSRESLKVASIVGSVQGNTFYEIMAECEAKGLLSVNKEVKNWEVMRRGKNKHFKIIPRE